MVVFRLFSLNKLWSLLCNLSRDTEINGYGLCWLRWLGLSHGAAGLPLRAGGAVRVLRIQVAASALKKLKEILLYGSLTAGKSILHLKPCSTKQARQMLTQLLSDLSVKTAIEEGIGGEAEVANPGDHLLQRGQHGRRAGSKCWIQVESKVGQPATKELSTYCCQHCCSLSSPKGALRSCSSCPSPCTRASNHRGAAAKWFRPLAPRCVHPGRQRPVVHGCYSSHFKHIAVHNKNDQQWTQEIHQSKEDHEGQAVWPSPCPMQWTAPVTLSRGWWDSPTSSSANPTTL